MKIVTVVGARPQFVKAAVISRAIANHNRAGGGPHVEEVIIHTGQHYDAKMSEVFFEEMQIPQPQYNLEIREIAHGVMTGRMLGGIESVLQREKPQAVLVYGDTNSTLAAALAAAKLQFPVAHVEAGLRSFRRDMPEEINRIITDQLSHWLFCPTEAAAKNLREEGFPGPDGSGGARSYANARLRIIGDVMFDAVRFYRTIAKPSPTIDELSRKAFALATVHRAENTDSPARLNSILGALNEIGASTRVILPVHPRTRKVIQQRELRADNVTMIDPVSYFDMLILLDRCCAVLTDSGGLQKEAFFFKRPCVTLRDETEWTELLDSGANRLAGAEQDAIVAAFRAATAAPDEQRFPAGLYGDGNAGPRILRELLA